MEIESKKPEFERKVIKSISVDSKIYELFKEELEKRKYGVSEVICEFMKKIVNLGEKGGKVIFEIHPTEHIGYTSDGKKKVYRSKLDFREKNIKKKQ